MENELLEPTVETVIDGMELEPDLALEMFDYTNIAMASLVETAKYYDQLQLEQMVLESDWIAECLECGFILPMPERLSQILEAEAEQQDIKQEKEQGQEAEDNAKEKVLQARASGSFRDLANAIKAWLDEIVANIRRQAVRRKQKYTPWLEDVDDQIGAAAAKMTAGVKIAPYLDGNWKDDVQVCVKAINEATNNLTAKQINDFDFAKPIVDPAYVANRSGVLTNYIKNYFRFGVVNSDKVKPVTLIGDDLVKGVALMIDYITIYDKTIATNVGKIASAYSPQKISKALQAAEADPETVAKNADANARENERAAETTPNATKESISPNQFLEVEGRVLCETILTSLINYESIIENGNTNNGPNNTSPKDATTGEKISAGKVDIVDSNNKEMTKEEQKEAKAETSGEDTKQPGKTALTNYMKSIEYFIKLLISSYATACDERFITFINVLLKVADFGKVPKPKFDIHGNYMGTKGDGVVKTAVNKSVNKADQKAANKQEARTAKDTMDEARNDNKNATNTNRTRSVRGTLSRGAKKAGEALGKLSDRIANGKKKE